MSRAKLASSLSFTLLILGGLACDRSETRALDSAAQAAGAAPAVDGDGTPAPRAESSDSRTAQAEVRAGAPADAVEPSSQGRERVVPPQRPKPGPPGPAYFAVDAMGLFALEDGSFRRLGGEGLEHVESMAIGGDNKTYARTRTDIVRVEGSAAVEVVALASELGEPASFSVAGNGEIWMLGSRGVGHVVDGVWVTETEAAFGDDATQLEGLAADDLGRVWVVSTRSLYLWTPQRAAWVQVELSRTPIFTGLASRPGSGGVVAMTSKTLLSIAGPAAIEPLGTAPTEDVAYRLLSFGPNGPGAVEIGPHRIATVGVPGAERIYERGTDYVGTNVLAVSVDGSGRTWIATDCGVSILVDAHDAVQWTMGTVPELAGRITSVLVHGAGPKLPVVAEAQVGRVSGTLRLGDQPFVNAAVELCPEPSRLVTSTPCAGSPIRASGTTAADGTFSLGDVPLGAYGVAVEHEGGWKITAGGRYVVQIREGETFDIGTLRFDAP